MSDSKRQSAGRALSLAWTFLVLAGYAGVAAAQDRPVDVIRTIYSTDLELAEVSGLTFASKADAFLLVSPGSDGKARLTLLNLFEDVVETSELAPGTVHGRNIAADWKTGSLVSLDPATSELVELPPSSNGRPNPNSLKRFAIQQLGVGQAVGTAFDPVSGDLLILDASVPEIVRIKPDPRARFSSEALSRSGAVTFVSLAGLRGGDLRGVAVEPGTGNIYVLDAKDSRLWAFSRTGNLVDVFDLSPLGLREPHSLAFGRTGDQTVPKTTTTLYVTDRTLAGSRITEFSTVVAAAISAPAQLPVLVNTIQTSNWNPPSPDPAGLAYLPDVNQMFVSDSEVDEMNIFDGANAFTSSLGGGLDDIFDIRGITREPAGVAYNPNNGHFFFSDDGRDLVYEVDPGNDGRVGTSDDTVRSFNTRNFNCADPEGLGFDAGSGVLYIADGSGSEIFAVDSGPNGVFDGYPNGDDTVSHFDTYALGVRDPEGVDFDDVANSLYIVTTKRILVETTTDGSLIRNIDIGFLNSIAPSGVMVAPGSQDAGARNIYVSDRAVDNGANPNENDGKIFEIGFQDAPPGGGTDNLLVNPSFELDANEDGQPDSWGSDTHVTRSNELAQEGTYSLKHQASDNSSYNIFQEVTGIQGGTAYVFSGWVNIPATSDSFTFKLQVQWRSSSGSTLSTATVRTFKTATGGWVEATGTLTAPSNASRARIRMVVKSLNGSIFVDNFVFQ